MTRLHKYTSKIGFSILVPDGWGYNENLEEKNLVENERESQRKWLHVEDDSGSPEITARIFIETLSGLSTGLQVMRATQRKVFYETLLKEAGKVSDSMLARDKTYTMQMEFLLRPVANNLSNAVGLSPTQLLIMLQRLTEEQRLQAKEDLGLHEGYFITADDNNPDSPAMTVFKFSMKATMTAFELYIIYKKSLPVWFWSGIPDKVRTIKNNTVDRGEMQVVEDYLVHTEPDSLNSYATQGEIGWVINCTAVTFRKHMKLFSKMIDSFCIEAT